MDVEAVATSAEPSQTTSVRGSASGSDLVDEVADAIHLRIMTGEYRLGTRLRQEELAEEFGTSRTPIREALRKLQAGGVIEVLPRRGAIVRGPNGRDIHEAYDVRAELEGFAAELAAKWITRDELNALADAKEMFHASVERFAQTERGSQQEMDTAREWVRANDVFHGVVQTASRNRQLEQSITDILRRCLRPRDVSWMAASHDPRILRTNVIEHAEIADALENHDGPAARRIMTDHIRRTGEFVTMWFENHQHER